MANNLKKFTTEAEYTAATLNYPAVSWVTSGDTVHFDKTAPVPTVNRKIKIAFTTDSCAQGQTMMIPASVEVMECVDSLTVNGEPIEVLSSELSLTLANNTDYLIEYELKEGVTNVYTLFNLPDIYKLCGSAPIYYDMLFPAQVTNISGLGETVANIILESTTPPNLETNMSDFSYGIYVPSSAVNTYKEAAGWGNFSSQIHPISEYSGDIPV